MKAAIWLENGLTQVVLTPEPGDETEAAALKALTVASGLRTYWGNFYRCQGGWLRAADYESTNSAIFVIEKSLKDVQE